MVDALLPGFGMTETFTGKFVNAYDLRPEDICIEDIAHHLAMECRFAGACKRRYSVGEHSLLVQRFLAAEDQARPTLQLAGLLHDAFETYGKDIPTPQKSSIYRLAEDKGMKLIAKVLDFEYPSLAVQRADRILCWLEADVLLPSRGRGWLGYEEHGRETIEAYRSSAHMERIIQGPGGEGDIEEFFLSAFADLKVAIGGAAPLGAIGRRGVANTSQA